MFDSEHCQKKTHAGPHCVPAKGGRGATVDIQIMIQVMYHVPLSHYFKLKLVGPVSASFRSRPFSFSSPKQPATRCHGHGASVSLRLKSELERPGDY
jgi:hypothetical protein